MRTGRKIIVDDALDPAGPEFYTGIFARKITSNDAQYVDAIHTNAGQLGIWQNVGQVDFYLNGGTGPQPGCIAFQTIDKAFRSITGACSHNAATRFYTRSILLGIARSEEFNGCSCESITKYKLGACGCDNTVTFGEYSQPGLTRAQYTVSA
ncbi:unnamed protein product [Allacma fusca]|uniref:Lipase domain-containing protein n=1 Tax=Allacma fusca TaxID=39272 RepID=A0A8J2J0F0_9HEXA|nr:unnamed protein product [Allacma fusca]